MVRVGEFAGGAPVAFLAMAVAMALQAAHINLATLFSSPPPLRLASNGPISLPFKAVQTDRDDPQKAQRLVQAQTPSIASPEEVALRVRDSVPAHLYPYFNVYLYVSKAASGPWAQQMFIFHKN